MLLEQPQTLLQSMTLDEALKHNFRKNPLLPEERELVIGELKVCLLKLGLVPTRLPRVSDDILRTVAIEPAHFEFDEGLDRQEQLRREKEEREFRTR
jgi:hypothetical protein